MKQLFEALVTYKIGVRFRRLILAALVVLIAFHSLVLVAPFISLDKKEPFLTDKQIKNLRVASNSLANITVSLILILIVVEGQNGLRAYLLKQRQGTYRQIRDDILGWMSITKPLTFDDQDDDAKFIYGSKSTQGEIMQHLKVTGSLPKLMKVFGYKEDFRDKIRDYSECVHFELTRYPAELLYGIHFELDDYDVSKKLCSALIELLNLARQSSDFIVDTVTPKKPGWIFLTRTVELTGNADADYAVAMTHARHFVELVCHSYDSLYSKTLIDLYLQLISKSGVEVEQPSSSS